MTPAQDIRVEIEGVLGASGVTDGSGDYAFVAPAGTHDLHLTAEDGTLEGFALTPEGSVIVAVPGPLTHDFELSLAVLGSTVMTGTVYASDGTTPVVGSTIQAYDTHGEVIGRGVSGAGGSYLLVIP